MIKFGTDGWRGVIGEDYTFNNVRLVAEAIAGYIEARGEADKGIVVGYDARFLSRQFAEDCAAVLTAKGIRTWLSDSILPTPALTWQVKDRQAAGGVMITASHNPYEYNGLKFKASYGGSASPEIVAEIEKYVEPLEKSGRQFSKIPLSGKVEFYSPRRVYIDHVRQMLYAETLSKLRGKVIFDMMHGASQGYARELGKEYGLDLMEIRSDYNPSFGGVNPEPIEKNLGALKDAVLKYKPVLALATDGDGDRIGAMDSEGRYINAHQIIALLIKHLVEKRGMRGGVVQTLTVSELVKRVAAKYGLKLYETPVGFKYVTELMLTEDILIGGEEAGGIGVKGYIPERDGLLLGFLLIEMVAAYGKPLGQILDAMMDELGWFYYSRSDLHLSAEQKDRLMHRLKTDPPTSLGNIQVMNASCFDGCKLSFAKGWTIFRASGTEPLVRIYSEADDKRTLDEIQQFSQDYAKKA